MVKRRRGFALKHKDEPVALVCATHARLPTGSRIDGDFLSPGYHWTALRKRVDRPGCPPAKPVVAPDPAMAPVQTMLTRFPSGFGDAIDTVRKKRVSTYAVSGSLPSAIQLWSRPGTTGWCSHH